MNSNYEAIFSLIELLVKKAGFDVTKDYSENELEKTKERIKELSNKKTTTASKKTISSIIENLKLRESALENNAEIVGKSLLEAYKQESSYDLVKDKIELLGSLALEGTNEITVSSVYERLKTLENEYKELKNKIETYDYINREEKEMDTRYKTYLENKISSLVKEIESVNNELNNLKEVETKDEGIVTELKDYISKLNIDKEKINKASKMAIKSSVNFDVWERLEKLKSGTNEKFTKANELLTKTENMLNDVKTTKNNLFDRKNTLAAEKQRCLNKLNTITSKLNDNKYDNSPEKMIDINNSEIMKLEINSLSNKKDVVYVDANKVKEELIKAWTGTKFSESVILENINKKGNEKVNNLSTLQDTEIKEETPNIDRENEIESTKVDTELDSIIDEEVSKIEKIEEDLKEIIDKTENFRDNIVDNTSTDNFQEPIEIISDMSLNDNLIDNVDSETLEVLDSITEKVNSEEEKPVMEVKEEKNKMELDW